MNYIAALLALAMVPAVRIDARYSMGTVFHATFRSTETISGHGNIPSWIKPGTIDQTGSVAVRRLPDDHRFTVSSAVGSYEETDSLVGSPTRHTHNTINGNARFDALGYPEGYVRYRYVVKQITANRAGHTLATLTVHFDAPFHSPKLPGWRISLDGGGTVLWDTTVHERVSSQIRVRYELLHGSTTITDVSDTTEAFKVQGEHSNGSR